MDWPVVDRLVQEVLEEVAAVIRVGGCIVLKKTSGRPRAQKLLWEEPTTAEGSRC